MANLNLFEWLMPIFSFLVVFIVVYALLQKSKLLGENKPVSFFLSFILAGMFIVNASLVEFVQFTSSWMVVIIIIVFLAFVLLAFFPSGLDFMKNAKWFPWVLLLLIIVFFITSSAFVFNWAINWANVSAWFGSDWWSMILLLIIAGVVSFVLAKK